MTIPAFNTALYVGKIKVQLNPEQLGLYARYDLPEDADLPLIEERLAKLPEIWRLKKRDVPCFNVFLEQHEARATELRDSRKRELHRRKVREDQRAQLVPLREAAELWAFNGRLDEKTRKTLQEQYVARGFSSADIDQVLAEFPDLPRVALASREAGVEVGECLAALGEGLLQTLGVRAEDPISSWIEAVSALGRKYGNLPPTNAKKNAGTRLYQRLHTEMQSSDGPRRILNRLGGMTVESMLQTVLGSLDDQKRRKLVERVRAAGAPDAEAVVHQLILNAGARGGPSPDEELRAQVLTAINQRERGQLLAAQATLTTVATVAPTLDIGGRTTQQILDELRAKIAGIGQKADQAARDEPTNPDGAYNIYQEILAVAVDYDLARQGLARCRPSPPQELVYAVQGASVHLKWHPSVSKGSIVYRVVRQERAVPTVPGAGTTIAEGAQIACEDRTVVPGLHYYYAVFSGRDGQWSVAAAVTGPVTRYDEVLRFELLPGDGMIEGRWSSQQPNSKGVRVFRFDSDPGGRWEGGIELTVSGRSFVDKGLVNGRRYYYRVASEYRDTADQLVLSPGVIASGRPGQLPKPVEFQSLSMKGQQVAIRWVAPEYGKVLVFRLAGAGGTPGPSGTFMATREVNNLGMALPEMQRDETIDTPTPATPVTYLPVTVAGDVAVIGSPRQFVAIPAVTQCAAMDRGRYIELSWLWPPGCRLTVVAWRFDRHPSGPDDPAAERCTVSLSDYQSAGFRINDPPRQPHYFAVFSGVHVGEQPIFSDAVEVGNRTEARVRPPTEVHYTVRRQLFLNRLVIKLRAGQAISALPEVIVVAREDGLQPTPTNQGIVLHTITGITLAAGTPRSISVKLGKVRRPVFVRLLLRDPSAASVVIIKDPKPAQLVIS